MIGSASCAGSGVAREAQDGSRERDRGGAEGVGVAWGIVAPAKAGAQVLFCIDADQLGSRPSPG